MVNVFEQILSSSTPNLAVLGLSTLGLGSWSVGLLEPAVAAYALRLYRSLGTRVGGWLFASFCLLALCHLLQSCGAVSKVLAPGLTLDCLTLLIPLLLLIGMAHTESTVVDRLRVEQKEQKLRLQRESEHQNKIAVLLQEKEQLQKWLAQSEEREKALEISAQQYYLLFADNPQPMWVFDLRSLRVLTVNKAALARYGFTQEECLAKTARDLLPAKVPKTFLTEDEACPAPSEQARSLWLHRKKDGASFEAQLTVVDLKYADCPARLVLAGELTRNRQRAVTGP